MKFKSVFLVWIVLVLAMLAVKPAEAAKKHRRTVAPSKQSQERAIAALRYRGKMRDLQHKAEKGRAMLNGTYQDPAAAKPGLEVLGSAVAPTAQLNAEFIPLWAYPVAGVGLILVGLVLGRRTPSPYGNPIQDEVLMVTTEEEFVDGSTLGLRGSWDEPNPIEVKKTQPLVIRQAMIPVPVVLEEVIVQAAPVVPEPVELVVADPEHIVPTPIELDEVAEPVSQAIWVSDQAEEADDPVQEQVPAYVIEQISLENIDDPWGFNEPTPSKPHYQH